MQSELQIKWVSRASEIENARTGINTNEKKKERLTKQEIEELMGVHGPRYEKRGRVIRQK